jgi:long-subunit acyl-CoA synthetase (AMP-forming)
MSEDFAYSHLSTAEKNLPGYVGVPYPDVAVRLSDEGEILIKSPGRMVGYYKAPALTAESFTEDGFFRTGDRGERRADGLLKITGRVKELFKTAKGKYVAPSPIENYVNEHEYVELSCVTGVGQPAAYALVVLAEHMRPRVGDPAVRADIEAALGEWLKTVNRHVTEYEKLQMFVIVAEPWSIEAGTLTPTMKIKRSRIEEQVAAQLEGWYASGKAVIWQ